VLSATHNRYDFENVSSEAATQLMTGLRERFATLGNGGTLSDGSKLASADDFQYTDPFDQSLATNQVDIKRTSMPFES
jgi:phosphoglucomutase